MAAVDNYNITPSRTFTDHHDFRPFDLSDYILLDDDDECILLPTSMEQPQEQVSPVAVVADNIGISNNISNSVVEAGGGGRGFRVAFRTKSEVEVLDDGFKWRKYGKKSVKNSPNPRNYYRCSTEGCSVKKRVERDRDDPSYVITTYDGIHNHTSSDVVYYATQDDISGQFVVSGCYGMNPNS
nr:WRKY transcription factor 11 [Crocus sativus]